MSARTVRVESVLRALRLELRETRRAGRTANEDCTRSGMCYRGVAIKDAMTIVKRLAARQARKVRKK